MTGTRRDQIMRTVRAIVAGEYGQPAELLDPRVDLARIEGADSVRALRSVARIENEYGITLADEAVFKLRRIDDVVNLVEAQLDGERR